MSSAFKSTVPRIENDKTTLSSHRGDHRNRSIGAGVTHANAYFNTLASTS
jgi:hypothetical protein